MSNPCFLDVEPPDLRGHEGLRGHGRLPTQRSPSDPELRRGTQASPAPGDPGGWKTAVPICPQRHTADVSWPRWKEHGPRPWELTCEFSKSWKSSSHSHMPEHACTGCQDKSHGFPPRSEARESKGTVPGGSRPLCSFRQWPDSCRLAQGPPAGVHAPGAVAFSTSPPTLPEDTSHMELELTLTASL